MKTCYGGRSYQTVQEIGVMINRLILSDDAHTANILYNEENRFVQNHILQASSKTSGANDRTSKPSE